MLRASLPMMRGEAVIDHTACQRRKVDGPAM
jgi:hypothetical protein